MFAFVWTLIIFMFLTAFLGTKTALEGEEPILNSAAALVHLGLAVWGLLLVL